MTRYFVDHDGLLVVDQRALGVTCDRCTACIDGCPLACLCKECHKPARLPRPKGER